MGDDLERYLQSVCAAVRRICQAQQDGHRIEVMAAMVAEDLSTTMQLGGPIPRLQHKIEQLVSAVDAHCPRPQEKSRE
jgi:hypothetical protein